MFYDALANGLAINDLPFSALNRPAYEIQPVIQKLIADRALFNGDNQNNWETMKSLFFSYAGD